MARLKPLTWLTAKGKQMACITVIWFLAVNITHDIENVYTDGFLDDACALHLFKNESHNSTQAATEQPWFINKSNKTRQANASTLI